MSWSHLAPLSGFSGCKTYPAILPTLWVLCCPASHHWHVMQAGQSECPTCPVRQSLQVWVWDPIPVSGFSHLFSSHPQTCLSSSSPSWLMTVPSLPLLRQEILESFLTLFCQFTEDPSGSHMALFETLSRILSLHPL